MQASKESLKIIRFLNKSEQTPDSFSKTFPFIHHFHDRGGNSSLNGFVKHCTNHELNAPTNHNVHKRLLNIQSQVLKFLNENPDVNGISLIKYQTFAKNAVTEIPF